jgi:hypothetical protein
MIGAAGAPAARADDISPDLGLAASSGNQYDPAVFDYSSDPSNLFAPVYTVEPTGPEDVMVTSASGGSSCRRFRLEQPAGRPQRTGLVNCESAA